MKTGRILMTLCVLVAGGCTWGSFKDRVEHPSVDGMSTTGTLLSGSNDFFSVAGAEELPPPSLVFQSGAKRLFTLDHEGVVTLAPGVSMDSASRGFWAAVQKLGPCGCER